MLAFLDLSAGQFTADALLIALIALNMYLGWKYGLLRRIVGFAGLYLACLAATNVGNAVAAAVDPGSMEANAWAFVVVLVVVVVGVEILGFLFNDLIQHFGVMVFDRMAGIVSGLIVGLTEALVIFLIVFAVSGSRAAMPSHGGDWDAAGSIKSAVLSGQLVRMEPQLHFIFSPVLPANLSGHLSEGTRLTTPNL